MTRVLVLGGTTEANAMAQALVSAGIPAIYSYAGRTERPLAQPMETRVGGFGGVAGLRAYLTTQAISHVIDATHPFAAGMSRNAVAACTDVPLIALQRAPWRAVAGDHWTDVPDIDGAVAALPAAPARVFLAIGRQNLAGFAGLAHDYLLRLVDAPVDLPLTGARVVIDTGPFTFDSDRRLLIDHDIQIVVSKNSGGDGARAKLDAARELGLRVIMIDRPAVPDRCCVDSVSEVLRWIHDTNRGV